MFLFTAPQLPKLERLPTVFSRICPHRHALGVAVISCLVNCSGFSAGRLGTGQAVGGGQARRWPSGRSVEVGGAYVTREPVTLDYEFASSP